MNKDSHLSSCGPLLIGGCNIFHQQMATFFFSKTKEKPFLHVITRQWNESRSFYFYSNLTLIYYILYKNSEFSNQWRDQRHLWHFIGSQHKWQYHITMINDLQAQISTKFNENSSNSPKVAIRLSLIKFGSFIATSEHGVPLKASAHYTVLYSWYTIKNLFIFMLCSQIRPHLVIYIIYLIKINFFWIYHWVSTITCLTFWPL